jgi:hypothetical protein
MTIRLVRLLVRLYPHENQTAYAEEIVSVLQQKHADCTGLISRVWFALRESAGLLWAALFAWRHYLLGEKRHQRTLAASTNDLPEEVQRAQAPLQDAMGHMMRAISEQRFTQARRHSDEEREARRALRRTRQRYGLGDVDA